MNWHRTGWHQTGMWLVLVLGFSAHSRSYAEEAPLPRLTARQLLYPAKLDDVAESLRPCVAKLLDTDQRAVDAADVKTSGVFVRVVTSKYILSGPTLKQGGMLGSRPFVFVTVPDALYGRSLLQVFSSIGYSADEVLTGQIGEEKVAVVFRWEETVTVHSGRDGTLPERWQNAVYPSTWDNLFSLVETMANADTGHIIPGNNQPPNFTKLNLKSAKERQFVLGFPESGKQRLKTATYSSLRDTQGSDWDYRQFLERGMSASEHFTGNGRCKPTIVGTSKPPVGFPEFLGPNREVTKLPEIAVIRLGALQIAE